MTTWDDDAKRCVFEPGDFVYLIDRIPCGCSFDNEMNLPPYEVTEKCLGGSAMKLKRRDDKPFMIPLGVGGLFFESKTVVCWTDLLRPWGNND
jgi:hypothetical protein